MRKVSVIMSHTWYHNVGAIHKAVGAAKSPKVTRRIVKEKNKKARKAQYYSIRVPMYMK